MKIIHDPAELTSPFGCVCAAIGMFDGVHLGHQQVIRQAVTDAHQHEAASLCVTFDRHPASILAPDRAPLLIQSLSQRLDAMAALGLEVTLLLNFDEAMSQIRAADFIGQLYRDLGDISSLCVGAKFAFGHNREGDVALLQNLGGKFQFTVHGLAAVALDGETVSSTRIRNAITEGQLDDATQMLGREYALAGKVIQGERRGRDLGCPTANLDCAGLCVPPNGVYAAHAEVDGQTHRAAVNLGQRPTVADVTPSFHVEAHLLDFDADLYGKTLALTFIRKIRDEKKFDSLEDLKHQITEDIAVIRKIFDDC